MHRWHEKIHKHTHCSALTFTRYAWLTVLHAHSYYFIHLNHKCSTLSFGGWGAFMCPLNSTHFSCNGSSSCMVGFKLRKLCWRKRVKDLPPPYLCMPHLHNSPCPIHTQKLMTTLKKKQRSPTWRSSPFWKWIFLSVHLGLLWKGHDPDFIKWWQWHYVNC